MAVMTRPVRGRESVLQRYAEEQRVEIAALRYEALTHARKCLPSAQALLGVCLYFGLPDAAKHAALIVANCEALIRRHK